MLYATPILLSEYEWTNETFSSISTVRPNSHFSQVIL